MSPRTLQLTDAVHAYLLEHGVRESPVLAELRERTAVMEAARMQIAPEQGAFMGLLVRLLDVHRVLEVGTFTGYSALVMAEAMPAGGRLTTCDVSEEWTAVAREAWQRAGVANRVELKLGPALETLDALLESAAGGYDLMFIDADKSNYDGYYERGLRLVRPGGVILVDNVLWNGSVANPERQDADTVAIRRLNEKIHTDTRVDAVMVPVGDGLTLARRR
ncbi:MAG: O-methyltransferase [Pseudomonadota bacterium]